MSTIKKALNNLESVIMNEQANSFLENKKLRERVIELTDGNLELRNKYHDAGDLNFKLKKENDQLLRDYDAVVNEYSKISLENEKLREELAEVKKADDKLNETIHENYKLHVTVGGLTSENRKLRQEVEALRFKLSEAEKDRDHLHSLHAKGAFATRVTNLGKLFDEFKLGEVAKRAEADVEALVADGSEDATTKVGAGNLTYKYLLYTVKFVVSKRVVVAIAEDPSTGKVKEKGFAKCHPNDTFNESIGKAIALRRALGLEVPSEYLGGK